MKCIICGNEEWKYLFPARDRMFGIAGKFSEYQCKTCGFVRLDPKPSQKELQKYYPSAKYYSYSSETKQTFFGWLRSYLITHRWSLPFLSVPAIPKARTGKILDIGCGSGETLALLQSIGWECYGLDIDRNAIAAARARGVKNATFGSFETMKKYPDNYFDVIRLYHVIEHLDDPVTCLKLAYKKLKRGGELIIGTPSSDSLAAIVFRQYWINLDAPRHLYIFSPKTLSTLALKNRFRNSSIEYSSAAGWVGSMQYVIGEHSIRPIDLVNRVWLVVLFYPFEWTLDRLQCGDVFVMTAIK